MILEYPVADGMHEMGFAQANAAIHKEGIVGFAGFIGYGHSCCMGKVVGLAGNEGVEGIFGI